MDSSTGFDKEREVDEPNANVENGVEKKKKCQTKCRETWMRWNGFNKHRLHTTEHLKHLEPCAYEKNFRVCHVINARGAVCFFLQQQNENKMSYVENLRPFTVAKC